MNGEPNCARPPKGWYCTKPAGHEGPCPAWPEDVPEPTPMDVVPARPKFTGPESTPNAMKLVNKLMEPVVGRMVENRFEQLREALGVSRETVVRDYAYAYPAEIIRWIDGDTVDMRAWKTMDMGFRQKVTGEYTGRFRLTIVDTPERGEPGWAEATDYSKEMLPPGTVAQIRTYRDPDVFGRYLADIAIPGMGTTSISSLLLQNGLAKVWK